MHDKQNVATRLCDYVLNPLIIIMLAIFSLTGCTSPHKISSKGIAIAKLGKEMPQAADFEQVYAARDTTIDAEGYRWPAVILHIAGEKVWIEGDFLEGKYINRVRVESDTFFFKQKIRVGSSLNDLAQISEDWEAILLPTYGMIDIACKGVHFLVSAQATSEGIEAKPQTAFPLDPQLIDRKAIIEAIVIL